MKELDKKYYRDIIDFIGEKPCNTTPIFFLKNEYCHIYIENDDFTEGFLLVPDVDLKDLFIFGHIEPEKLKSFLKTVFNLRTLTCSKSGIENIIETGYFKNHIKNVIYSLQELPEFYETEHYPVRITEKQGVKLLLMPIDSTFMFKCFKNINDFLKKGVCYGIVSGGNIISCASTHSISDRYIDISVYTRIPHRRKNYSYSCSMALIKEIFSQNKIPTWTTGEDHILSRKAAEKLKMTTTDELYCFY